MFWKNKDNEKKGAKLPAPREIPEILKKQIISRNCIDPDILPFLKAVVKHNSGGDKSFDFRVYDPAEAEAQEINIANYTTLDAQPDMVICDGVYDESTKKVDLNVKRSIPKYQLLTYDQIFQQIESLKQGGDSVFFYMAAGTGAGGPLGRGAAIIRLNPVNSEKRVKKYSIYGAPVIKMQPVSQREAKIFDSDKSKDVAKWIVEGQKPRFC